MYKVSYRSLRIKDIYKKDRPRERLVRIGASGLSNTELLAIVLGTGYKGKNVIQVANKLLKKYSINNFPKLSYKDLKKEKGLGDAAVCRILASLELTKRIFMDEKDELPVINNPEEVYELIKTIRNYKKEYFVGVYLNARNQLIHQETISIGTLTEGLIHPREVFEPALRHHAVSVIVAHNHPSGNTDPSEEDITQTKNLVKAGKVLGIELLDHLIISNGSFLSFKEIGEL